MTEKLIELYRDYSAKYAIKEAVYRTLRDAIIRNILPSGYRIKDSEISEFLKVSRSPVREALQMLLRRKLVDANSNNGYTVRELTINSCLDLVHFTTILRTEIVKIVEKNITPSQIDELETKILTIERVREFYRNGKLTDCYKVYQDFYYELALLTGNKYLCSELELLHEKLLMMHYRYPQSMKVEFASGQYPFYHRQIIDSLRGKEYLPKPHELVEKYANMMHVIRHMYNLRQDWV